MDKLIAYFSRQHVFVNTLSLFVLVVGLISTFTIKRDVFPNISFDMITVTTVYPKASATSVESLITNPLEADLRQVEGIKEIISVSSEGRSVITLTLDPDQATVADAKVDVDDVVQRLQGLPDAAEDPVVVTHDTKTQTLIEVSLFGDVPMSEIRPVAKELKRLIEGVKGVARVSYTGLPKMEIRVEADPEKLRNFRVTLADLVQVIRRANVNIPAGTLEITDTKSEELVLRTWA